MDETHKSHAGRFAIRTFRIAADAFLLLGRFRMNGRSGAVLQECLRTLSPEIYGSMNDPRCIELKGLEYVMDRLPRGIEECSRFVMTSEEDLGDSGFPKLQPPMRRRTSYRISEKEMCFTITRGFSEIYDILTHLTFLYIEAKNINGRMRDQSGTITTEWREFERFMDDEANLDDESLNRAIWNLSIILGRTFHETKESYAYFEASSREQNGSNGLFRIIHQLSRWTECREDRENDVEIQFTPELCYTILHEVYGKRWAADIKEKLVELQLEDRPLHIISSNLHSVFNLLYGYSALRSQTDTGEDKDIYELVPEFRGRREEIREYAVNHGLHELPDKSGAQVDCQIIDTSKLDFKSLHPDMRLRECPDEDRKPVILVMDYAFGTQGYDLLDSLFLPMKVEDREKNLNLSSFSAMGKAGTIVGKKGDIFIPTSHVLEGTAENYILDNDLKAEDFAGYKDVFVGPVITVLGTSLQNRVVLETFKTTSWKAVGLEMEGGHYHRALNAAIIRQHVGSSVRARYAYYASDNPLESGQTLASGSLGTLGIKPTYMIAMRILDKIFSA